MSGKPKPSERIKQICGLMAEHNAEEQRQYLRRRGAPGFVDEIKANPDDPALIPTAIIQYLDEQED